MIRRPPRSTLSSSSAASDVYKRQLIYPMDTLIKPSSQSYQTTWLTSDENDTSLVVFVTLCRYLMLVSLFVLIFQRKLTISATPCSTAHLLLNAKTTDTQYHTSTSS
eukprot:TRINITY_DN7712_c0_g1_i3.p1 TRINITY_DN7712_c0_g1~~TRINITY_DN7712_c0_g1_i3.p1  ORF type:complete len:107 (+),score=7.57 TRINITY_DN7712_c0_g1_i3:131-451(+)